MNVTETKKKRNKQTYGATVTTISGGFDDLDRIDKFFNKDAVVSGENKDFGKEVCTDAAPTANSTAGESSGALNAATDGAGASGGESCAEELITIKRYDVDVECPKDIKIIPEATVNKYVDEVGIKEDFTVGYITLVHFYKEIDDAFTLLKCTELDGWTGIDYIEARAETDDAHEADRIARAASQIADGNAYNAKVSKYRTKNDDDAIDDGNVHANGKPMANYTADHSATYSKINKTVWHPERDKDGKVILDAGGAMIKRGDTILFYPKIGSVPRVVYYIDLLDGNGYIRCTRNDLEATIYPAVEAKAKKRKDGTINKVRAMLAQDAATIKGVEIGSEDRYETRSAFDTEGRVTKPSPRAFYTNQVYYFDCPTKGINDGTPIAAIHENESLDAKSLTEKRETKRYYVRPQDIFCANKADVLKALIDVSNAKENCSVYTLKNLDDHDDVHKLTNNDIIYYYDNDVLYDKNHVMVMDYDLFIKHEEERKKINKDPAALTKTDYDQNYDDRMTQNTFVENKEITETMNEFTANGYVIQNVPEYAHNAKYIVARYSEDYEELWFYGAYDDKSRAYDCINALGGNAKLIPNTNLPTWNPTLRSFTEGLLTNDQCSLAAFKLAMEREEEVDLGYAIDDAAASRHPVIDGEPYSHTNYFAYKDGNEYIIDSTSFGHHGENAEPEIYGTYDNINDLLNAILSLELVDYTIDPAEIEKELNLDAAVENPFNQTFEAYDVFGNKKSALKESREDEPETCVICGEEIIGYGNNAEPYKAGRCCDACNMKFVIPTRLAQYNAYSEVEESLTEAVGISDPIEDDSRNLGQETTALVYDPTRKEFKKITTTETQAIMKNTPLFNSTGFNRVPAVELLIQDILDYDTNLREYMEQCYEEVCAAPQDYGFDSADDVSIVVLTANQLADGIGVSQEEYDFILNAMLKHEVYVPEIMDGLEV